MELFITDPQVIKSARATEINGPWHIREAMKRIAGDNSDGTPVDLEKFAEQWFTTWAENENIPGISDTFAKRPWVAAALRSAWRENRIRLIAIVNRIDLTKFPGNDPNMPPLKLGEGRFIYEVMKDAVEREPFTLIFEYRLAGDSTQQSLQKWAEDWHQLGKFPSFNDDYLKALAAIVTRFSAHGLLNQIRTNEFLTPPGSEARIWELREFHFDAGKARLLQDRVNLTPSFALRNSDLLKDFVRNNITGILNGVEVPVPDALAGASAPVPAPEPQPPPAAPRKFSWNIFGPGQSADLQRAGFIISFNTCSGCHAGDTGTLFQHIGKNAPDLSDFLTKEITLPHKLPGEIKATHNEMAIREEMLKSFLSGPAATDNPQLRADIMARATRVH